MSKQAGVKKLIPYILSFILKWNMKIKKKKKEIMFLLNTILKSISKYVAYKQHLQVWCSFSLSDAYFSIL